MVKRIQDEAEVQVLRQLDEDDDSSLARQAASEGDDDRADAYVSALPALVEKDCLIEVMDDTGKASTFSTLKEQHLFMERRMLEMARQGHDEEDGWSFTCNVDAGVSLYQRSVPWSNGKQWRVHAPAGYNCSVSSLREKDSCAGTLGTNRERDHFARTTHRCPPAPTRLGQLKEAFEEHIVGRENRLQEHVGFERGR